jgi:hypothetical protein
LAVASATKKALACAKAFLRESTRKSEIAGVLIFEGEKYGIDHQRKWRVDQ